MMPGILAPRPPHFHPRRHPAHWAALEPPAVDPPSIREAAVADPRTGNRTGARATHPRRRRSSRALHIAALVAIIAAGASCTLPRWPVDGTLTSPFGLRFRGLAPDVHPGVDIAAPAGTPIMAMKAGRVAFAGTQTGYGLTVVIRHGPNLSTRYAHMSELLVRSGDTVTRETVLGRVGATGNATAPHLHFEIIRWGHPEDPVTLLGSRPGR